MGWLRLVGSLKLKLEVSFAREPCKRDDDLRKRPIMLRSLLIVAIPFIQPLLPLPLRAHTHTGWARRNEKWGAEFTTNMSKETCIYFTTNFTWWYTYHKRPIFNPSSPLPLRARTHTQAEREEMEKEVRVLRRSAGSGTVEVQHVCNTLRTFLYFWSATHVKCNTLQHTAQSGAVRAQVHWKCNTLQHTAHSVLIFEVQHIWSATLCNTPRTAGQCGLRYIESATRCNTPRTLFFILQVQRIWSATLCNTMRTAVRRSAGSGMFEEWSVLLGQISLNASF